jgi:hypothetical protein
LIIYARQVRSCFSANAFFVQSKTKTFASLILPTIIPPCPIPNYFDEDEDDDEEDENRSKRTTKRRSLQLLIHSFLFIYSTSPKKCLSQEFTLFITPAVQLCLLCLSKAHQLLTQVNCNQALVDVEETELKASVFAKSLAPFPCKP